MHIETIIEIIGTAGLTAIGCALLIKALVKSGIKSAMKLNFDKHLERYKSELTGEIEKLRLTLRKSETIFSQQFVALVELRRIYRNLIPRKRHPDMKWPEALGDVADSFSAHADALDEFLCKHQAVLPNDVLKKIEHVANLAHDGTFEFTWNRNDGAGITVRGMEIAEELYDGLREASIQLQELVDSQVGGRT